jgi:hypothetical protein
MKKSITQTIQCMLLAGFLQASAQTTTSTIVRNGYASGEHAVFKFNGNVLSIRYGSDRSGLGISTDWYAYANGAWRAMPKTSHHPVLPVVHIGECDPDDALDISSHFPRFAQLLSRDSKLKDVEMLEGQPKLAIAISSKRDPNRQTGSILQISLLSDGETPTVLATQDIGEDRVCSVQWNAQKDATRNLIVFTLQPAGSSVSYAFQSFKISVAAGAP